MSRYPPTAAALYSSPDIAFDALWADFSSVPIEIFIRQWLNMLGRSKRYENGESIPSEKEDKKYSLVLQTYERDTRGKQCHYFALINNPRSIYDTMLAKIKVCDDKHIFIKLDPLGGTWHRYDSKQLLNDDATYLEAARRLGSGKVIGNVGVGRVLPEDIDAKIAELLVNPRSTRPLSFEQMLTLVELSKARRGHSRGRNGNRARNGNRGRNASRSRNRDRQ